MTFLKALQAVVVLFTTLIVGLSSYTQKKTEPIRNILHNKEESVLSEEGIACFGDACIEYVEPETSQPDYPRFLTEEAVEENSKTLGKKLETDEEAVIEEPSPVTDILLEAEVQKAVAIKDPSLVELPEELKEPPIVAENIRENNVLPIFTNSLDEDSIKRAVVKIKCSNSFGSGFVIFRGRNYYVLTAEHVVISDYLNGVGTTCDVIFPLKDQNENYREGHYRTGEMIRPEESAQMYTEDGIDFALLRVIPLKNKEEELRRFPTGYPFLEHPFCTTQKVGERVSLFGYAGNVLSTPTTRGAFLSRFTGVITQFANVITDEDILHIEQSSEEGDYQVLITALENNFFGASGGLVFNTDRRCIAAINFAKSVGEDKPFGFATNVSNSRVSEFIETTLANENSLE